MNVGIVGIQGFGGTYLRTIAGRPRDQVVALCDLDADKVAALADAHGVPHRTVDFGRLLAVPGLEAVFIATPHFLHHPMVMAALNAGKHVFCEKPLAITSADAAEMAAAARAAGLTLTCHYNQRTARHVAAMRQLVRSGRVGRPYQVNARWMARWTEFMFDARTSWRLQSDKSGGGIMIGRGSHLIDAVLYVLDFPKARSVAATMHRRLTGGEVDDFATATLRLENDTVVNVQCSYVAHTPAYASRTEYEIFGTDGGVAYLPAGDGQNRVTAGRVVLADGSWQDLTDAIDGPAVEKAASVTIVDDFLDAAAAGRDPLVTGEQAAYVTRVLEAAYASDRLGREVTLPD